MYCGDFVPATTSMKGQKIMEYTKQGSMLRFNEPSGTQTIINLDKVVRIERAGDHSTKIYYDTEYVNVYAITLKQFYHMIFDKEEAQHI